ncbi:MAG: sulfite oxidase [Methanobacteriota archaeon]|nr:MAG: sulfite oxidase [Euryarchaeota archaeon]
MRILSAEPLNAETPLAALEETLTPESEFFVRSHFGRPDRVPRKHVLEVVGAVEQPVRLNMADLEAMGTRTLAVTVECAGNGRTGFQPLPAGEPWGLGAVSTARWTGVPLRAVLESARLRPRAVEVLAIGADRGRPPDVADEIPFARSLPLAKARDPDTLLALQMNGRPILPEHGAPIRLIVPGWYGMASVKWLERLEVLSEPFRGYYQLGRYVYDYEDGNPPAPVRTIRVRSVIVSPQDGDVVRQGHVVVRGQAWSGEGVVVRVQIGVDGVEPSQDATLSPPISPHAWRAWEFGWDATNPGRHVLRSYATDAKGNRPPDVGRWNRYGYGNNAVQAIAVTVQ